MKKQKCGGFLFKIFEHESLIRSTNVALAGNINIYELLSNKTMTKKDIEFYLISTGLNYSTEFKFLSDRKFRFDFYLPDFCTGIEYEGIISAKARHTSVTGFTKDCEKYNLAQLNGYKVLRYTALNVKDLIRDVEFLINLKKNDVF